jgi:hypothetical protein
MNDSIRHGGRRTFLRQLGRFGAAGIALRRAQSADDPIAALPPEVWRNARRNGLVMIRHPAPAAITSRAKIVPSGEPGEPLVVTGRVFAPDGNTPVGG